MRYLSKRFSFRIIFFLQIIFCSLFVPYNSFRSILYSFCIILLNMRYEMLLIMEKRFQLTSYQIAGLLDHFLLTNVPNVQCTIMDYTLHSTIILQMGPFNHYFTNGPIQPLFYKWAHSTIILQMGPFNHYFTNGPIQPLFYKWAHSTIILQMGPFNHYFTNGPIQPLFYKWAHSTIILQMGPFNHYFTNGPIQPLFYKWAHSTVLR